MAFAWLTASILDLYQRFGGKYCCKVLKFYKRSNTNYPKWSFINSTSYYFLAACTVSSREQYTRPVTTVSAICARISSQVIWAKCILKLKYNCLICKKRNKNNCCSDLPYWIGPWEVVLKRRSTWGILLPCNFSWHNENILGSGIPLTCEWENTVGSIVHL